MIKQARFYLYILKIVMGVKSFSHNSKIWPDNNLLMSYKYELNLIDWTMTLTQVH
jgi:hypothetical protein